MTIKQESEAVSFQYKDTKMTKRIAASLPQRTSTVHEFPHIRGRHDFVTA